MRLYSFAELTDEQLENVRAFEKETGKTILVFREFEMGTAALDKVEIERLRSLEKELGNIAVAVK